MQQCLDGVILSLLLYFSHVTSEGRVWEWWSQLCVQGGKECINALVLSEAVLAVQENVLVMLYDGAVKHPFGQVLGEDLSGFDTFGSFLRLICPFPLGASASLACIGGGGSFAMALASGPPGVWSALLGYDLRGG